jgi:hypothetical protein
MTSLMGNCASYRESPAEPEGKFYRFFEKYVNFMVESIRPSDGNIAPGLFFRPTDE